MVFFSKTSIFLDNRGIIFYEQTERNKTRGLFYESSDLGSSLFVYVLLKGRYAYMYMGQLAVKTIVLDLHVHDM